MLAHAVSLALVLGAGILAIDIALIERAAQAAATKRAGAEPVGAWQSLAVAPSPIPEELSAVGQVPPAPLAEQTAAKPAPLLASFDMLRGVLRFSIPAMLAGLAMMLLGSISLWFVQHFGGRKTARFFQAFFQFCQPIPILATTVWSVLFTYAAVHWEHKETDLARRQLEAVFKITVAGLTTLAVLIYATSDLSLHCCRRTTGRR